MVVLTLGTYSNPQKHWFWLVFGLETLWSQQPRKMAVAGVSGTIQTMEVFGDVKRFWLPWQPAIFWTKNTF